MADLSETTTAGVYTGGPGRIYSPRSTGSGGLLASQTIQPTAGMRVRRFAFTNVNDADTWTSGLTNIMCIATTALTANTDVCSAQFTAAGVVTFSCTSANGEYGLTVWTR